MYVCFSFFSKISLKMVSSAQGIALKHRFECCDCETRLLSLAQGRLRGDKCHACFSGQLCQCTLILICSIPAIPVLDPSCAKFYSLFVYSWSSVYSVAEVIGNTFCAFSAFTFSFAGWICLLHGACYEGKGPDTRLAGTALIPWFYMIWMPKAENPEVNHCLWWLTQPL